MIRNIALLMLLVFTFMIFVPAFMQPQEAEADNFEAYLVGLALYVM